MIVYLIWKVRWATWKEWRPGSASANHHGFIKKELLEIFCATCNYNCHYLSTVSKRHLMAEMTAMDLSVPLENLDRTSLCYMMYLHHSLRQKDPGHIFLT